MGAFDQLYERHEVPLFSYVRVLCGNRHDAEEIFHDAFLAALSEAVRRLPPALGELYHLRTNGLSYEQIARVVEVPLGTVKSRMHQLVNLLREELEPWIAPQ